MSMFRNLLIQKQGQQRNDLAEVYAYANSIGVTPQQVNSAIGNNTALRERLIAWKFLIHSLVNTGYTPWLVGDGVAYIDTGIAATNATTAIVVLKTRDTLYSQDIFGARISATNSNYSMYMGEDIPRAKNSAGANISGIALDYNSRSSRVVWAFAPNTKVAFQLGKTTKFDNEIWNWDDYTFTSPSLYMFSVQNGAAGRRATCYISSVELVGQAKFVPYYDNGTYGMLDLVSNTFFGSAAQNGLFSYRLDDSNGNAVNIT